MEKGGSFLRVMIFSSVQFSRTVPSDSLWPHEMQHARPPCPSPTLGVYPDSCPLSWWCHPTISSSVVPSLAAKNIINLISVLTIWWCSCVESSLMLLEEGVCQMRSLGKTLLPCFILYSKAKSACYSRCFLTFYFCIPGPCNEKDIFFGVSSQSSCRSS